MLSGSMQRISIIKKLRNGTRINNPSEDDPVAATLRRTLIEMLIQRKGNVKIKRTHGTKWVIVVITFIRSLSRGLRKAVIG